MHAKTCVIDDVWATVGSDNFNRRSWTWDSELGIAVLDEALDERAPEDPAGLGNGARRFARHLRLALACEHLGRAADDVDDLLDPVQTFEAFARTAAALRSWHDGGRRGPRPPGRVTPAWPAEVPRSARGGGRHPCTGSSTTPTGGPSSPGGVAPSEPTLRIRVAVADASGSSTCQHHPVPDRPPAERS